ncbi:MAG: hypothetical protein ACI3XP_02355, partial [Eubacteriales bacterium]
MNHLSYRFSRNPEESEIHPSYGVFRNPSAFEVSRQCRETQEKRAGTRRKGLYQNTPKKQGKEDESS